VLDKSFYHVTCADKSLPHKHINDALVFQYRRMKSVVYFDRRNIVKRMWWNWNLGKTDFQRTTAGSNKAMLVKIHHYYYWT